MMQRLAAVGAAIAVLVAASAAAAADSVPPAGFWTNARLAAPASAVAGKPVTAYCAYRQATIDATVGPEATNTLGATPTIGGEVIYLAPVTCAYLNAWLNGKKPKNLYGVAASMETLAHEAELAAGISDETTATCLGLRAMPAMVRRFFALKKRESLHDLMGDAYRFWRTQSSVYHAHPC